MPAKKKARAVNTGRPPKFTPFKAKYKRKTDKQYAHKTGRPRKHNIDWDKVLYWAKRWATAEEIASKLGIPVSTLTQQPEFAEIYKKGYEVGKCSLRRAQFETAIIDRNPTMQIFLGKAMLGQSDRTEVDVNVSGPAGFIGPRPEFLKYLSDEEIEQLEKIARKLESKRTEEMRPRLVDAKAEEVA